MIYRYILRFMLVATLTVAVEGTYVKSITIAGTMSPGVKVIC